MREPLVRRLAARPGATPPRIITSLKEAIEAAAQPDDILFLDHGALEAVTSVNHVAMSNPIIAVSSQSLADSVGWLQKFPRLSHVINDAMLEQEFATEHLANVVRTLTDKAAPRLIDWMGPEFTGRRIRLTHANRRSERIDRMSEFFAAHNVGPRSIQVLSDAAEELLTNAFYDAPAAAKVFKKPVPRTQDVRLPDDSACDLAYGVRDDLAVVRVRDPFGSFQRGRLVEVLERCAQTDMSVQVDESMGGAGLGMWRLFSTASFVAISVMKDRHTEILVGTGKRTKPKPFGFHLFFRESAKRRFWQMRSLEEDSSAPSVNRSVSIIARDK